MYVVISCTIVTSSPTAIDMAILVRANCIMSPCRKRETWAIRQYCSGSILFEWFQSGLSFIQRINLSGDMASQLKHLDLFP